MARRKRGRRIDGWLIVDKPEGVGSTTVVGRARRAFDAEKAGHAGTLDPLATGLLAIAFGEATKTVPYAQDGLKTYRFTARWGEASSTDDREGEIVERSPVRPTRREIEAALPRFTGDILQRPPAFSAIKVEGARAYDLARRGEAVELAERPIHVERLSLIGAPDADSAEFEMVCGKGGYVRAVARDLGAALGTCAHVVALRRVASGGFTLDGAMTFAELEPLLGSERLLPVAAGLAGVPSVEVSTLAAERLRAGEAAASPAPPASVFWAAHRGEPVAILETETGAPRIRRVFLTA